MMPTQYEIYVQYESHRYKELTNIQSHSVLLNCFISSFEKVNVFLISAAVLSFCPNSVTTAKIHICLPLLNPLFRTMNYMYSLFFPPVEGGGIHTLTHTLTYKANLECQINVHVFRLWDRTHTEMTCKLHNPGPSC